MTTPTNTKAPREWKIPLTTLIVNDDAPEGQNKIHVIEAIYAKELEAEVERLKSERDAAVEALRFYGDRRNAGGFNTVPDFILETPAGIKARAVLAMIDKGEK